MGGYGSGRWGWHRLAATVEASSGFPVNVVEKYQGWITWKVRGEPVGSIGYHPRYDAKDALIGTTLHYRLKARDATEWTDYDYPVQIVTRITAASIPQRLWRCPLVRNGVPCDRLVRTIYLPPSGVYFGCRHCYRLTYAKNQSHDKRFDYLAALMRGDLRAARRFAPEYHRRLAAMLARVDLP